VIKEDEVKKKIEEAWNCFQRFRKSDPKERAQKLLKLAEILKRDSDKYATTLTKEMGKPIKEARREVENAIKECEFFAKHIEDFQKPEVISSEAKKSLVFYQPLGVIYHVTPFNFPFWLIFRGTVAAISMGNTVVNKKPQTCPETGILAEEAFKEAGFNNGEFINLIVSQKASESIISNEHIRGVSFTGSTEGGQKVAEFAGKHCKKTVMELGGSDPFIVLKDADLDLAVQQGIKGRLFNAGQCCTAAKRFIIDESIYEDFKNKLIEGVKKIKVGDPLQEDTDVGPLAKKGGLEKIEDQVKRAKEHGDKLLFGGGRATDENLKKGYFFKPTVFEINKDSPLFKEETFGPIFGLLKFKDEQEAIKLANDSEFGLGGAVFCKDEQRAIELAKDIETGGVYINHMFDWDVCCPEGGIKNSGFGREGGKQGAHEFVNAKTVWIA